MTVVKSIHRLQCFVVLMGSVRRVSYSTLFAAVNFFLLSFFTYHYSKDKSKATKGQATKKESKARDSKEPSQKWKQLNLVVDADEVDG